MCRQTLYNSITLENLGIFTKKESQVMMRNSLNIAPGKKLCKLVNKRLPEKKILQKRN